MDMKGDKTGQVVESRLSSAAMIICGGRIEIILRVLAPLVSYDMPPCIQP